MTPNETHAALVSALTQFDLKQSTKPGYNKWALAIYIGRVDDIMKDVAAGADLRAAVVAGFTGQPLAVCLRALKLPSAGSSELSGANKGAWHYVPCAPVGVTSPA